MSDPNEKGAGVSATIKFPESARYKSDNPWIVFHGSVSRIREDIVEAFGLDESAKMLSLSDLVLEAQTIASAQGTVASSAGGRTVSTGSTASASSSPKSEPPAEKPDEPAKHPLLSKIENLDSIVAHRNCWADDKAELQADNDLLEAWKTKGRELKDAAAA